MDPLVKNEAISGKSKTVSIPQNSVPNGYYYFQIYVTFTNGGTTIHYSPRFKLTGMSGPTATLMSPKQDRCQRIKLQDLILQLLLTPNLSQFHIPYKQEDQIRTNANATRYQSDCYNLSMKFPTSAVTYQQRLAQVASTITPGWSYTAESAINYASVAPYPTYWYPASERVSKATVLLQREEDGWIE